MSDSNDNPFEWTTGRPYFHGLPVLYHEINIAGQAFRVAALKDAADLLDLPEFEERFIKHDIAPYGLELWPAAMMLSEHIARGDPGDGRAALELGCGVGLVGVVASKRGWQVTVSDNDEDALRFSRHTASINDVKIEEYAALDWTRPLSGKRFSRIFAADVLYQLIDHAPLVTCIDAMLAGGGEALVADPNRGVADTFARVAIDGGFNVDVTETALIPADGSGTKGRIFRLTR